MTPDIDWREMMEEQRREQREPNLHRDAKRPNFEPKERAEQQVWEMDKIHAFDIEAHEWTNPVAIGVHSPDGDYRWWHNGESADVSPTGVVEDPIGAFLDYAISRPHRAHKFVAHNGGGYDFGFVLRHLLDREDYELTILNDSQDNLFYIESTDDNDKNFCFLDSMKLMPRGLDSLSASFCPDVQKKEPDHFDKNNIPEHFSDMDSRAQRECEFYLKRDCVALRRCVDEFTRIVREELGGVVSKTVGATTIKSFQQSFFEDEEVTEIAGETPRSEQAARKAYQGGRTEVFRQHAPKSEGPYYHYDVNSLYPTAYTNYQMPVGKPYHAVESGDWTDWMTAIDDQSVLEADHRGGVAKIIGWVPEDTDIPVLCCERTPPGEDGPKVLFPTGYVEGWHQLSEIRYALEVGALENVYVEEAYLSLYGRPFQNYGQTLYEIKQNIDKDEEPGKYKAVKFLLNSFYGKFAMEREQTSIIQLDPEEAHERCMDPTDTAHTLQTEDHNQLIAKGIIGESDEAEADYIIPRVGSEITARARILMHQWFERVREKGGRIWYCDTDSIVTDVKLPTDGGLGEMDLEHVVEEAYFLAPKTYAEQHAPDCPCRDCEGGPADTTLKAKGMGEFDRSNDYSEAVTFEDYRRAYHDDEPGRIMTKWQSVRSLGAVLRNDEGNDLVATDTFSRSLSGFDGKRDHSVDGLTSDPLHF